MSNEIIAIHRFGSELTKHIFGWDLGRRCNYDCSYCPAHRHNNYSPHAMLDDLFDTYKKVSRYKDVLKNRSLIDDFVIGFTGGEPAANPIFWDFCNKAKEYDNDIQLGLTSNGTIPRRVYEKIGDYIDTMTVSYHCEADDKIKQNVQDAIFYIHSNTDTYINVNVMFHSDEEYFNECLELCRRLDKGNVSFVPRIIGEIESSGLDGKPIDKEFHSYSASQLERLDEYYVEMRKGKAPSKASVKVNPPKVDDKPIVAMAANKTRNEIGRPCCGKVFFNTLTEENFDNVVSVTPAFRSALEWNETQFLRTSKFKDWYCLVHLYLPHLQHETRMIYAHQTCQATTNRHRQGPLCTIETFDEYIDKIDAGNIPIMQCPNMQCNCGLCTPKSKYLPIVEEMVKEIFPMKKSMEGQQTRQRRQETKKIMRELRQDV